MNILMLDDDIQRFDLLHTALEMSGKPFDLIHAMTAQKAFEKLTLCMSKLDYLLLDHDLGDHQECEETGMTFVNILERSIRTETTGVWDTFVDRCNVIVHSHNAPKAIEMVKVMDALMTTGVWRCPFHAAKIASAIMG
jgi:hypothetical protein